MGLPGQAKKITFTNNQKNEIMNAQSSFEELAMHFPQVASLKSRYNMNDHIVAETQGICRTSQDQLMLELAYALLDIEQAEAKCFERYSIALLVDFLKRTHRQYVGHDLPLIAYTIEQLAVQNPDDHRIQHILLPLFQRFADDLHAHILWEERGIFPLALIAHQFKVDHSKELPSDYHSSLHVFLAQHPDHADELELLYKLIRQLSEGYTSDMAFRMLSKQVEELRRDLKLHHLIEEKVLTGKLLSI